MWLLQSRLARAGLLSDAKRGHCPFRFARGTSKEVGEVHASASVANCRARDVHVPSRTGWKRPSVCVYMVDD